MNVVVSYQQKISQRIFFTSVSRGLYAYRRAAIRHLHAQLRRPLVFVPDRFNVHRSAIRQLQERCTPWLDVEWLPAYAPDLNPVDALWSCTKHGHLANYNPDDLFDLGDAVVDSFCRQRRDRRIKESYFLNRQAPSLIRRIPCADVSNGKIAKWFAIDLCAR